MKNFTRELKNIMTEDPGVPIMSPDELRARSQTIVILTNSAPDELLALAGPDRKATLLSINPPMITLPYQKGVFKVRPEDIVFENHHTGRDVTEAGGEETPYEKFFSQAMKKFGVSSPIELSPDDTKKFFNYVDKNWEAEEESDGSNNEIAPLALAAAPALAKLAKPAAKVALGALGGGGDDKDKSKNEIVPLAVGGYLAGKAAIGGAKAVGKGITKVAKPIVKKGEKVAGKVASKVMGDKSKEEIAPALGKSVTTGHETTSAKQAKFASDVVGMVSGDDKDEQGIAGTSSQGKMPLASINLKKIATDATKDMVKAVDKGENVSTGKVGKKDKGSYQHAYKLALKKYQIHSADELDTPAERKGFTDYVDRLWKKGDIHRDKKEGSIDQTEWVGTALKLGAAGAKALSKSKTARKAAKGAAKGVKKMATSPTTKKLAKKAWSGAKKAAKSQVGQEIGRELGTAAKDRAISLGKEKIAAVGKKKKTQQQAAA